VKRLGFRGRLFLILLAFALIPSILISLAWNSMGSYVLPFVSADGGVEQHHGDRRAGDRRRAKHAA